MAVSWNCRGWCPYQGREGFDGCVEWEDW